jgi:thiamine-monophosphate kinase
VAREVAEGANGACQAFGIAIQGGDLSRSSAGLLLDIVVFGRAAAPVLRSGCRVGDEVWVTGYLGAAAAAVRGLVRGDTLSPRLREAFLRPRPRIHEALWLTDRLRLGGLIDLSDGLAGDAGHLAAASGVALVLEEELIPVHHGAVEESGPDGGLELALTGGEDYELCFTAPSGSVESLTGEFFGSFGVALTRVGRVEGGTGVRLVGASGQARTLAEGGFSHFSPEEPS